QVPRVGHLIETDEQRLARRRELVRVRVAERLDSRDDALAVARPGELGQHALGDDLRLPLPPLPRRPLGREELPNLPPPPHRPPPPAAARRPARPPRGGARGGPPRPAGPPPGAAAAPPPPPPLAPPPRRAAPGGAPAPPRPPPPLREHRHLRRGLRPLGQR